MIDRLQKVIEKNFQNELWSVEELASMMNMSRSHLHSKLKQSTGKSADHRYFTRIHIGIIVLGFVVYNIQVMPILKINS